MLFIFSMPVLIRHLRQLETVVFLYWCLIHVVPLMGRWFCPTGKFGHWLGGHLTFSHLTKNESIYCKFKYCWVCNAAIFWVKLNSPIWQNLWPFWHQFQGSFSMQLTDLLFILSNENFLSWEGLACGILQCYNYWWPLYVQLKYF